MSGTADDLTFAWPFELATLGAMRTIRRRPGFKTETGNRTSRATGTTAILKMLASWSCPVAISDVVPERQRRNILDGAGCQYLPYRVREFQRYRHAVAKNTGVVVEFGEGKNVL